MLSHTIAQQSTIREQIVGTWTLVSAILNQIFPLRDDLKSKIQVLLKRPRQPSCMQPVGVGAKKNKQGFDSLPLRDDLKSKIQVLLKRPRQPSCMQPVGVGAKKTSKVLTVFRDEIVRPDPIRFNGWLTRWA